MPEDSTANQDSVTSDDSGSDGTTGEITNISYLPDSPSNDPGKVAFSNKLLHDKNFYDIEIREFPAIGDSAESGE